MDSAGQSGASGSKAGQSRIFQINSHFRRGRSYSKRRTGSGGSANAAFGSGQAKSGGFGLKSSGGSFFNGSRSARHAQNGKKMNVLVQTRKYQKPNSGFSVEVGKGFFDMKNLLNLSSYTGFLTNCNFDGLMSRERMHLKFRIVKMLKSLRSRNGGARVEYIKGHWLNLAGSYYMPFWLILKLGIVKLDQIKLKSYILSNYLQPVFF